MALGNVLARLGVPRVFGEPLAGAVDTGVRDPLQAVLLADADGAVGAGVGAWFDGAVLAVTSRPGATPDPAEVHSGDDVVTAIVEARRDGADAVALRLGFDPADAG